MLSILTGNSPRIIEATVQDLDKLFGNIFRLIGLREANFPNDLETLFLYQFIRENYPNHRIDEVLLAFKKAVLLQLDIPANEVKCYENFSVLYLSTILNAYRCWASAEYSAVEKHLPSTEAEKKLLENSKHEFMNFHWGEAIESAYQDFLTFGNEKRRLYPVGMYEQLVRDKVFSEEKFREFMQEARAEMLKEASYEKQRNFNALTLATSENSIGERAEFAASIHRTNMNKFQNEIDEIKSGKRGSEIELLAKQTAISNWFFRCKTKGLKNVYQRENL